MARTPVRTQFTRNQPIQCLIASSSQGPVPAIRGPQGRQGADGAGQVASPDDGDETGGAQDAACRARLSIADLERRDAGGREQARRGGSDRAEGVEAVGPAVEGMTRLPGDFGGQAGDVGVPHIGRVANDRIECSGERGGPVGSDERRTPRHPQRPGVRRRDGQRVGRTVDADAESRWPFRQQREQKAPRPRAEIEHAERPGRGARKRRLDEGLAVGARDEDRRADSEFEAAELADAGHIGERLARLATADQGGETRPVGGRQQRFGFGDLTFEVETRGMAQKDPRGGAGAVSASGGKARRRPAQRRGDAGRRRGAGGANQASSASCAACASATRASTKPSRAPPSIIASMSNKLLSTR